MNRRNDVVRSDLFVNKQPIGYNIIDILWQLGKRGCFILSANHIHNHSGSCLSSSALLQLGGAWVGRHVCITSLTFEKKEREVIHGCQ